MKDVATMKVELKKLIDTAAGRVPADLKETLHFQVIRLQVSVSMKA